MVLQRRENMNQFITTIDTQPMLETIYLYARTRFIKITNAELYLIMTGYVSAWKKRPNIGLTEYLESNHDELFDGKMLRIPKYEG